MRCERRLTHRLQGMANTRARTQSETRSDPAFTFLAQSSDLKVATADSKPISVCQLNRHAGFCRDVIGRSRTAANMDVCWLGQNATFT